MNFFVGDRVRLLFSKEEGIITRILNSELVEVAIDSDFEIPVSIQELVHINREEATFTKTVTPSSSSTGNTVQAKAVSESKPSRDYSLPSNSGVRSVQGIYLACVPYGNQDIDFVIINNTDIQVLYAFFTRTPREIQKGEVKGISSGILEPKQHLKIYGDKMHQLQQWPSMLFELIRFADGYHLHHKPVSKQLDFRASQFKSSLVDVPALKAKAHLFQLDNTIELVQLDVNALKEKMMSPNEPSPSQPPRVSLPKPKGSVQTIDLHIENLVENPMNLSNADMITLQLGHVQQTLDKAVLLGIDKITFIHGVGNGVLKSEIQKILSKYPHVDTFKDAMKEKFGYGATEVYLK